MSEACKEKVYRSGGLWGGSRCARNAVRDGFCAQHHPDAVRDRRAKSLERWRAESDARAVAQERVALRAEFASECAKWLADPQAVALSPSALYTGNGPEDRTFGDVARLVLAPVKL